VPRGGIRRQARHCLLRDAVLHHERPHRHSVMAVILDQCRCCCRSRQHRSADRPDADDAVRRLQGSAAARLLREGNRRLDVDMPRLRVRVAHRVRHRQRLVKA